MKITLDIEPEEMDNLFCKHLKESYKALSVNQSIPMFSSDEKEEKKKMTELKSAFKVVGNYFGAKL